jgi:hypothetical protein
MLYQMCKDRDEFRGGFIAVNINKLINTDKTPLRGYLRPFAI